MWIKRCVLILSILLCINPAVYALEIVPDRLNLYGYFDVTPGYNRYGSGTAGIDAYHWVTILSWNISDKIRVVGDLTLEHGPVHTSDKAVGDIKTRSFVQITQSDILKITAGKFLSPFGIYNLVHDATPTYLSVSSPRSIYWKRKIGKESSDSAFIKDRLFAKEVAGFWVSGDTGRIHDGADIEYNVYVVNGRAGTGSNEFQGDDNDNKGIGGKLVINTPYNASIGGSFYTEKNGALEGDARIATYAFQGSYLKQPLFIEAEYQEGMIDAHAGLVKARPRGYYIQIAYGLGHIYTPYVRHDVYRNRQYDEDERITTVGLNYMLHPQVYLKGEYGFYNDVKDVIQFQMTVGF